MNLYFKTDYTILVKKVLEEKLSFLSVPFEIISGSEIQFSSRVSAEEEQKMIPILTAYGFEVVENHKNILVEKIKDLIQELVKSEDEPNVKFSAYLAEELAHSYGYLSNLFSEVTYSSIENFVILQKIEYAKQLMSTTEMSLTEIAFKLHYSSVAHLSKQFKNTTGITPSAFVRILEKRRQLANQTLTS